MGLIYVLVKRLVIWVTMLMVSKGEELEECWVRKFNFSFLREFFGTLESSTFSVFDNVLSS